MVLTKPLPQLISNGIMEYLYLSYWAKEIYATIGGAPHLDGQYTVFGKVVEGLEVIDKIAGVKTGRGDRPEENIRMKVRVIQ